MASVPESDGIQGSHRSGPMLPSWSSSMYALQFPGISSLYCFFVLLLLASVNMAQGNQSWEGFVENEGVRTHYRAAGSGPLLLLCHGFPDNSETFYNQVPELAKQYTVVTPTLRGFPPSDFPDNDEEYQLSKIVADLVTLIKHFGARKVLIGGHDFGRAAVQLLALSMPDMVEAMILMNAPILPRLQYLVNVDPEQQKASEYTLHYVQYKLGDDKGVEEKTAAIRDAVRRKEIQDYLTASPVNGMMAYYKQNYPAPPYGRTSPLQNITLPVPTLILWGVEDTYFIPKFLDGIPSIFPNSTRLVTLPHVGHWAFQDEPKKVTREIVSWLEELKYAGNE